LSEDTKIFQTWFVPFFFGKKFARSWNWPKAAMHLPEPTEISTLMTMYPKPMKRKWRQLLSKLKQDPSQYLSFTLHCFIKDCVISLVPEIDVGTAYSAQPSRWMRRDVNLAFHVLTSLNKPMSRIFDMLFCFQVLKNWISRRKFTRLLK
jgi:hypothetical protein